eukprot:gene10627-22184_t
MFESLQLILLGHLASMVISKTQKSNNLNARNNLSFTESGGFFNDISDAEWRLKWEIHCNESREDLQNGRKVSDNFYKKTAIHDVNYWNNFWQANYEPTWSCGLERRLGQRSDGGKWICDPHRIDKNDCLVYSIGSNNQFDFEEAIHEHIPTCEIHTFDPYNEGISKPPYVTYHRIGIYGNRTMHKGMRLETFHYFTKKLNHTMRTIDILKMDIEGAEYHIFTNDFFQILHHQNVTIRQIAIEFHPMLIPSKPTQTVRKVFDLFRKNNYVIFHKEPNILFEGGGRVVEYSFLLIDNLPSCPQN